MILIVFFRLMVLQLLTPICGTWDASLSVTLHRTLTGAPGQDRAAAGGGPGGGPGH